MPHARVKSVDAIAAVAVPGVKAILRADDLPRQPPNVERALTDEPLYAGEPILALAAVDESTAAAAIERIEVDLEPLPFVIDSLESLSPTARMPVQRATPGRARRQTPASALPPRSKR